MRTIWGPVTEVRDLGVVAEQCPYCEQVLPCFLRSVCRGHYVFFVKTTVPTGETSCLCTVCLKAFPCEHWHYADLVSIREAKALPVEDLLARTNPGLAERRQLNEQIGPGGRYRLRSCLSAARGNAIGCVALAVAEAIARPGPPAPRAEHLAEAANCGAGPGLALRSTDQERVSGSPWLPDRRPCRARRRLGVSLDPRIPQLAGCGHHRGGRFRGRTLANTALMRQRVFRWTREILIPEARRCQRLPRQLPRSGRRCLWIAIRTDG